MEVAARCVCRSSRARISGHILGRTHHPVVTVQYRLEYLATESNTTIGIGDSFLRNRLPHTKNWCTPEVRQLVFRTAWTWRRLRIFGYGSFGSCLNLAWRQARASFDTTDRGPVSCAVPQTGDRARSGSPLASGALERGTKLAIEARRRYDHVRFGG